MNEKGRLVRSSADLTVPHCRRSISSVGSVYFFSPWWWRVRGEGCGVRGYRGVGGHAVLGVWSVACGRVRPRRVWWVRAAVACSGWSRL